MWDEGQERLEEGIRATVIGSERKTKPKSGPVEE